MGKLPYPTYRLYRWLRRKKIYSKLLFDYHTIFSFRSAETYLGEPHTRLIDLWEAAQQNNRGGLFPRTPFIYAMTVGTDNGAGYVLWHSRSDHQRGTLAPRTPQRRRTYASPRSITLPGAMPPDPHGTTHKSIARI